jgi:hypothetical protein
VQQLTISLGPLFAEHSLHGARTRPSRETVFMGKDQQAAPTSSEEYQRSFDKGREQRKQGERTGSEVDGMPTHPEERDSGHKGHSNVGQDETSGDG